MIKRNLHYLTNIYIYIRKFQKHSIRFSRLFNVQEVETGIPFVMSGSWNEKENTTCICQKISLSTCDDFSIQCVFFRKLIINKNQFSFSYKKSWMKT